MTFIFSYKNIIKKSIGLKNINAHIAVSDHIISNATVNTNLNDLNYILVDSYGRLICTACEHKLQL